MSAEEQLVIFDSNGWTTDMRIHSYNSQLSSWDVTKPPSIWNDRRAFGLTLINSTMVFAGGYINGKATNEVLCLDLKTMKFYENPAMLQARTDLALVELNEDLYAVGGLDINEECLFSVEKYNFSKGKWEAVAPLMSLMKFVTLAVLDGFLYAIGEYAPTMECYDPSSNKWSRKAAPKSKLQYLSIIGFDGFLYAACRGYSNGSYCVTMEKYDPLNDIWETIQTPLYGEECTVLQNRLLTYGIIDSSKKEYVFEEYNPEDKEWKILTHLNITPIKDVYFVFTSQK